MNTASRKPQLFIFIGIILIVVSTIISLVYLKSSLKNSPESTGSFLNKENIVPAQYNDKNLFLSAIKQSKAVPLLEKISGITVPHHLLASDIMAEIYTKISLNKYQRLIVISPDHFSMGKSAISYSTANFDTVFGTLETDQDFVKKLSEITNASSSKTFYREHGLGVQLPFIKYFFPQAKIVLITLSLSAQAQDLEELFDFLKTNIGSETLLVQSTDFSHYLPASIALEKDQETINILSKIDTGANSQTIYNLNEPANIDCLACQYLQSKIQSELFKSKIHFGAHKNSQDYTSSPVLETTSYISQIYY